MQRLHTRREVLKRGAAGLALAAWGPAALAGAEEAGAPDLVLHGGQIATVDPGLPEVSALAIRAGRIVEIAAPANASQDVMAAVDRVQKS